MLGVLGEVEITVDGEPRPVGSHLQRALLAALALDRGRAVSTGRLADLIWGDRLPANPTASLQSHISRLRRGLPPEIVVTTVGESYRLDVAPRDLDVALFEECFQRACSGELSDIPAAVDRVLPLWRGVPFLDLDDPDASAEAARLDEMRQSMLEMRADWLLSHDRIHEAIADLENLRRQFPLRERPVELLMKAYLDAGRKSDSLEVYQQLRRSLGEELGLQPSPALRNLEAAILREEVVAERSPGATADTRAAPARRAATIALPASAFVGRTADLAGVAELLAEHRIVTIVGPGGVGKTRLAVHVGHGAASRFTDGAVLIELSAVPDPTRIPELVASTLGVRQLSEVALVDRIVDHLGGHEVLLVIDNCEHVIDEAARVVEAIVGGAPRVAVIATSREALNIDGERVWRLAPLGVEDGHDAAVTLFADRATAADPGFALDETTIDSVRHICRRLDGLPLAIELAAARLSTLTLDEVVAGLDERFEVFNRGRRTADERHRSLRAVVDWSCQQLDRVQLEMFTRLSVFAGRFSTEAAVDVCGPVVGGANPAGLLADLVERSLLGEHRGPGVTTRYGYLETIRAYAAERLAHDGDPAAVRDRHAAWVVDFVESTAPRLFGGGETEAARQLLEALPDLRAAHHHLLEVGDADRTLRLSAALHGFASLRMHSEILGWSVAAADRFGATHHPLTEAVLASASTAMWQAGDNDASRRYARASGQAAVGRSEPGAGGEARAAIADTMLFDGDPEGSLQTCLEAIELKLAAGNRWGAVYTLADAVMCAGYIDEIDRARELARRARYEMGEDRPPSLEAWVDYAEGEALAEIDPQAAIVLLSRALELAESAGARFVTGVAGLTHTSLLARRGDPAGLVGVRDLVEHWRQGGAWTQQWITMRMVVQLLVESGDHEGAAVLLGALEASDRSSEVFGADAERLRKARAAVEEAVGDRAPPLEAIGAAKTDIESVHYALDRIERIIDERRIRSKDRDVGAPVPGASDSRLTADREWGRRG